MLKESHQHPEPQKTRAELLIELEQLRLEIAQYRQTRFDRLPQPRRWILQNGLINRGFGLGLLLLGSTGIASYFSIQTLFTPMAQEKQGLLTARSPAIDASVHFTNLAVGISYVLAFGLFIVVIWRLKQAIRQRRQAEDSGRQTQANLETLVQNRTAELTQTIHLLQAEIQECKQQESQLRLLESVVCTTNDAVVITEAEPIDKPGPRIVYVNPAFTKMTGYTLEDVLGQTPRILQGDQTDRATLDQIRAALATWQPVRVDLVNYRKDGSAFWVELNITPVANETGWFTHWVAVQRDITDRKQAGKQIEAALRQSEAKFRSLSESSPNGVWMTNTQGQTLYTNPRAQEICGYSFAEALGIGWTQFIHPDDLLPFFAQWEKATLPSQNPCQNLVFNEVRHVHKDGSVRYGRIKLAPLLDTNGQLTGYVGSIEDTTEQRQIENMKNEFVSIVSHELRTPLTAIRGSLGLLSNGVYDHKPEKGKKMLQLALTQTERLVRLVSDILDLKRLESGQVPLIKQNCEASTLMTQSAEMMQALAQQNHITLSVAPLSIPVWVAPDAITQTLTNLISNAIKFSPAGSTIWLSAELLEDKRESQDSNQPIPPSPHPSIHPPTSHVRFAVKDQGRGIPSDKIETIFGQFQQVDASDSRQKGGTGLGLAICRSIVQQHGGQIWVESVLAEGSTFYFTLPISSASREYS